MSILSALCGVLWGALAALLGGRLSKAALRASSTGAVMVSSVSRTAVDIGALAAVYLLRHTLPVHWEAAIIGTAVGLTAVGFYLSWRLARRARSEEEADG